MPKVSVIVPNYNHGAYLQKRIDSILNQTFQDFEVIILDDVSVDNSKDIIEQYRGNTKVQHIVYNAVNSGSTFKQWDKGVGLARGEYIWFAESDDWCEPSLLEHLVHGIESDEDCVVSYCQAYCVDGVNKIRFTSHHGCLSEIKAGDAFIRDFMIKTTSIFNASMAIWKKKYYDQISRRFIDFKMCGDWLFWVEMAGLGKVHISGRVLNYFRKHDADVSGAMYKTGKGTIEEIQALQIIFRKGLIDEPSYAVGLRRFIRAFYKGHKKFSPQVRQDFESELKNALSGNFFRKKSIMLFKYKTRYRYQLKHFFKKYQPQ
ncbi:glycosyltransferase family 2 protein [Niabella hirudinis]|uniref:glycosyltransferase family 2 protein n=1 Tax=Niabella hirudinis TaxID=1285929 RepID=UPI003EBC0BFE